VPDIRGFQVVNILIISNVEVDLKGTRVPWSAVPDDVPSVFTFSTVLVVPANGTEREQQLLFDLLHRELAASLDGGPRIVWVLNAASRQNVAEQFRLGKLVPLRHVTPGNARSLIAQFSPSADQLSYAIADSPASSMDLCYLEWSEPKARVVIAACSADLRWVLIPPSQSFAWLQSKWSLGFDTRSVLRAAVGLVAIWLICAGLLYYTAWQDYLVGIGRVAVAGEGVPAMKLEQTLKDRWLNPGARMVARTFERNRTKLLSIVGSLKSGRSPADLWQSNRADPLMATNYFHLALLAGDLPSAYEIMINVDRSDRGFATPDLTSTLWQTAVEYLHELDFRRAWVFDVMYLESAKNAGGADDGNLTLAHILDREVLSGRIRSLCSMPGVEESFGRLLGAPLGQRESEEFIQRRNQSRSFNCSSSPVAQPIDYGRLAGLRSATPGDAVCSLFALECDYLRLTGKDFDDPGVFNDALKFSSACSYLSDDLFYEFMLTLNHTRENAAGGGELVPWPAIIDIAKCLEESRGDYSLPALEVFESFPCQAVQWGTGARLVDPGAPSLRAFRQRCERTGALR